MYAVNITSWVQWMTFIDFFNIFMQATLEACTVVYTKDTID